MMTIYVITVFHCCCSFFVFVLLILFAASDWHHWKLQRPSHCASPKIIPVFSIQKGANGVFLVFKKNYKISSFFPSSTAFENYLLVLQGIVLCVNYFPWWLRSHCGISMTFLPLFLCRMEIVIKRLVRLFSEAIPDIRSRAGQTLLQLCKSYVSRAFFSNPIFEIPRNLSLPTIQYIL